MASSDVAVRPRRSAFAAAFLSFLFPGLGHLYLGRWLRALLWAALPILALAALGGLMVSPERSDYVALLADPDVLLGALVLIVIDLFYRLFALLDAYRLASDPTVGSSATRLLSTAGLVAIIVALLGTHVAVAQPIFLVTDTFNALADSAGDESEVADLDALAAQDKDFVLNFGGLEELGTTDPEASPGASEGDEGPATTLPPPPGNGVEGQPEEEPTPNGAGWDGKARLNILLIGADGGRVGVASYLTDTMIVVSVDPTTGRVAFISLPRDTAGIPLPRNWAAHGVFGGAYNNKINTLYTVARGRPDLFPGNDKERGYNALMGALGELYGLDIDYYVAVDLSSFRSVVNTLGGVVVDVQLPVWDDGYPSDDGRGKLKLYVPPGMTRMNGQQALAYARSRHGSNDFDRSARQQRVITSVRDQTDLGSILQPGILDDLVKQLRKDIDTNIPPKLIPAMLSLAQDVDLDRRENLVLSDSAGYSSVCYPCGPSGLWMLKAKPALIRQAAQNVFSTSKQEARTINRLEEEGAVVHVLNGQPGANTKALNTAAYLAASGLNAVVPPVNDGRADTRDYTSTLITVYNDAAEQMPQTIKKIKRTFKDEGVEVIFVDDPDQDADVVVTVGKDTKQLKP